jgi:CheY-like chemotaxis protein
VGCTLRGGEVDLHVEDNGSGIRPARRPRVFEPFFTTKGQGTGLGLAVVKQVAEGHGGRVEFETEEGQGTTFHLRIPYRPAPLVDARSTPAPRPLHLLVVEDDPDSREILVAALREAGHSVAAAASADEAMARLCDTPLDVVISDYQLGGARPSGEAIVRAAKRHEPPIPTVLVTGVETPDSADADATLHKPLAVADLLELIDRLVTRSPS